MGRGKKERFRDCSLSLEERVDDLVGRMTLEEKASQILHNSAAIERLGIGSYNWWNECLHGVGRNGRATVFPQAIGLAASFDAGLVGRVAEAISDEGRAKHHKALKDGNSRQYCGLNFWSPNINIFRDPRWGRGHESYGEDPYLTGEIGAAFVKGLQGDDDKYLKVAACAKHYAVHSGPEPVRHEIDVKASLKDINETYLPAFKRLVDAGVETVMGAYNRVNGEPACANDYLFKKLRDAWGFKGHFVSDCGAVRDFHLHHKVTAGPEESVKLGLEKGCDLNCGCVYGNAVKAVKDGLVSEEVIDRAVKRVLMTRFKLGLFDDAGAVRYASISDEVIDCDAHRELAREAARKSLVLLKNDDGVLPLSGELERIYVTGHNAASVDALLGNYFGLNGRLVTVLEGIAGRAPDSMTVQYHPGCMMQGANPNPNSRKAFDAPEADLVVAVMGVSGFYEGEEGDSYLSAVDGDREDIRLPQSQVDYLEDLFETGKPVVVVILSGSAIDISAIEGKAAAILWAWYPGQSGGDAVADVLFGDFSPAGRLPVSFPKAEQLRDFEDYSMQGRTYRFMEERPLYPFGYGLSYSAFDYGDLDVSGEVKALGVGEAVDGCGGELRVSVDVRNVGGMDADEVVQVYVKKMGRGSGEPLLQLGGFERVSVGAGESVKVSFTLSFERFYSYDENGDAYVSAGDYEIFVGGCQPGYSLPVVSTVVGVS